MFASNIDFFRMEPKPFCLHRTERANNHIKQGDTVFFARNPIGVIYNQLTAMLTDAIHTFSHIASFGMLGVRKDRLSDSKLERGVGTNGVSAREFTLC
jgi:hypothetical protein